MIEICNKKIVWIYVVKQKVSSTVVGVVKPALNTNDAEFLAAEIIHLSESFVYLIEKCFKLSCIIGLYVDRAQKNTFETKMNNTKQCINFITF